jgi:hypothetical protein
VKFDVTRSDGSSFRLFVSSITAKCSTAAKAHDFSRGIRRRKRRSQTAETARLSPSECLSCDIERGTFAPIPGQSDNLRQPAALSERPSPEMVERLRKSTSEPSRAKEQGRSDAPPKGGRVRPALPNGRSNGGLALPVDERTSVHELETTNEPACGAGRWESHDFSRVEDVNHSVTSRTP